MPETVEALAIVILFVVPGFILGSVYNRNLSQPEPTDAKFVVLALSFSIVNHLIASPWSIRIYEYWHQSAITTNINEFVAWVPVVTLILPFFLALVFSRAVEASRLQGLLRRIGYSVDRRTATCWDLLYQSPGTGWVIMGLQDGTHLGGKFGLRSYIAKTVDREHISRDLFLEEAWVTQDPNTFAHKIPNSKGLWVNGAEVKWIKFFRS